MFLNFAIIICCTAKKINVNVIITCVEWVVADMGKKMIINVIDKNVISSYHQHLLVFRRILAQRVYLWSGLHRIARK